MPKMIVWFRWRFVAMLRAFVLPDKNNNNKKKLWFKCEVSDLCFANQKKINLK